MQFSWEIINHICTFNLYIMSAIYERENPPLCSMMKPSVGTVNTGVLFAISVPMEVCPPETDCRAFTWEYASINHHDEPCVRFRIIQQNGDDWINWITEAARLDNVPLACTFDIVMLVKWNFIQRGGSDFKEDRIRSVSLGRRVCACKTFRLDRRQNQSSNRNGRHFTSLRAGFSTVTERSVSVRISIHFCKLVGW